MENNEDKRKILSEMSLKDAISRCGELQLTFDDVCWLMAEKTNHKCSKPENLLLLTVSKRYFFDKF